MSVGACASVLTPLKSFSDPFKPVGHDRPRTCIIGWHARIRAFLRHSAGYADPEHESSNNGTSSCLFYYRTIKLATELYRLTDVSREVFLVSKFGIFGLEYSWLNERDDSGIRITEELKLKTSHSHRENDRTVSADAGKCEERGQCKEKLDGTLSYLASCQGASKDTIGLRRDPYPGQRQRLNDRVYIYNIHRVVREIRVTLNASKLRANDFSRAIVPYILRTLCIAERCLQPPVHLLHLHCRFLHVHAQSRRHKNAAPSGWNIFKKSVIE